MWYDFSDSRYGPVAGSCDHGNKHSSSIKGGRILGWVTIASQEALCSIEMAKIRDVPFLILFFRFVQRDKVAAARSGACPLVTLEPNCDFVKTLYATYHHNGTVWSTDIRTRCHQNTNTECYRSICWLTSGPAPGTNHNANKIKTSTSVVRYFQISIS